MSLFIAIMGVIIVLVYNGLSARFDAIVDGREILARWTYPSELWRIYSDAEYKEGVAEVKPLFILTSAMALIAGVGAFLWDPEPGIYVLGVMVMTVILMGFAAFLTRKNLHHDNLRHLGEAIISRRGVLLNKSLFYWDFFGSKLEKVELRKGRDYSVLIFTTWAPTMQFGQSYSLRVPVPPGEEDRASGIALTLKVS